MSFDVRRSAILLGVILAVRLVTLGSLPLLDKTEGRYGEIGREMAETGDWITPALHGEPFWGKPPLHFWLTAASIRVLGVNEWGARLPGFLAAVGIVIIVLRTGSRLLSPAAAYSAAVILSSSLLFHLLAGQVLLDMTFTLTLTGALASFLHVAYGSGGKVDGLLTFGWLGLAMLTKGPVGVVLFGIAITISCLTMRSFSLLRRLPWVSGFAVFAAVAGPWYWLAERKTPGFWNYFFVNEHLLRYTQKEYGDLYGHGHTAPYGLVWLLAIFAVLPWAPMAIREVIKLGGRRFADLAGDPVRALLWGAMAAPLVFFTASRALSWPYVLPALPPLALIVGDGLTRAGAPTRLMAWSAAALALLLMGGSLWAASEFSLASWQLAGMMVTLSLLAAISIHAGFLRSPERSFMTAALSVPIVLASLQFFAADGIGTKHSTKHLRQSLGWRGEEVLFLQNRPFSAEFYFQGRAVDLGGTVARLDEQSAERGRRFLVCRTVHEERLDESRARLEPIGASGDYLLFHVVEGAR